MTEFPSEIPPAVTELVDEVGTRTYYLTETLFVSGSTTVKGALNLAVQEGRARLKDSSDGTTADVGDQEAGRGTAVGHQLHRQGSGDQK